MNNINIKNRLYAVIIIATFVGVPCRSAYSTEYSIDAVFFKTKMPSSKDGIITSLDNSDDYIKVLRNNRDAINSLKNGDHIKIVGHTDSRECLGLECERLSLRRAQLIYKWMLANDVPKSLLLPPEGHGSSEPIEDNETSEGRARNRYVQFEAISASSTP